LLMLLGRPTFVISDNWGEITNKMTKMIMIIPVLRQLEKIRDKPRARRTIPVRVSTKMDPGVRVDALKKKRV
jgi:hypothetical protein